MARVFISYSRRDQPFVRTLAAQLDAAGRESWVDWEGIAPSAKWMNEIRAAIDAASAFVFVISPDSVASRVCGEELEHAAVMRKRIIPVVARAADHVPQALAELNWVTFAAADDAQALTLLVTALDRDPDWVREHTRVLVRAREWDRAGREPGYLLRGKDLASAEQWLAAASQHPEPKPTELHTAYILRSRTAQVRTQRLRIWAAAAAVVLSLALAVWALTERQTATRNAGEAQKQEQQAKTNQREAERQQALAQQNEVRAKEQESLATENARQAEARRIEAERQTALARAGELVARSTAAMAQDPEQAMQLALASLATTSTPEAEHALREAVKSSSVVAILGGDCAVTNATFGPLGSHVLGWCNDGSARVWDARTADRVLRVPGSTIHPVVAEWAPDEATLYVGGEDGSVRALSLSGGREVLRVPVDAGPVRQLVVNPPRRQLLVWRDGVGLQAYSTTTLAPLWKTALPAREVRWVKTSDDGAELAVLWPDPAHGGLGSVRYFNAASGELIANLGGNPEIYPRGSVFDREGRRMLRLGDDEISEHWNAATWNLRSGKQVAELNRPAGRFDAAAIDNQGRTYIVYRGNVVQVWLSGKPDDSRQPWIELSGHTGHVLDITVRPTDDGSAQVLTAGADGTARLWQLTEGAERELRVLRGHRGAVNTARFSPRGDFALTVGADRTARVWRLGPNDIGPAERDATLVAAAQADGSAERAIRLDESMSQVLLQRGPKLRLLQRANGRSLCDIDATPLGFGAPTVLLDARGRRALLVHERGTQAAVFDLGRCRELRRFGLASDGPPLDSDFSADASTALIWSGQQRVIDLDSGREIGVLRGAEHIFKPARFVFAGRAVLALDVWANQLVHWDGPPYGRGAAWPLPLKVEDFVVSPNRERLAARDRGGLVLLVDIGTRRVLRRWTVAASAMVFSADGRRFAARDNDGSLHVWNADDGTVLVDLPPDTDTSSSEMHFSAQGQRLMSSGGVWAVPGGQRLNAAPSNGTPWADGLWFVTETMSGLRTVRTVHRCLTCEPLPALIDIARSRIASRSEGLAALEPMR